MAIRPSASSRLFVACVLSTVALGACSKGPSARSAGISTGGAGGGSPGTAGVGTGGIAAGTGGRTGAAGATASRPEDAGAAAAGGTGTTAGAAGAPGDAGTAPPIVEAFATAARGIAADYLAWGRVDDELRWAPFLCRIPLPGIARPSESNDSTTHGQKLYSVFARNHDAYPSGPQTDQVVVKQSWTAERVTTLDGGYAPSSGSPPDAGDHFYGYAKTDGGVYRAADLAGLYIMFRLPEATPENDQGWVYATITAAGEVTAAGRVASCMGCHEMATHERLFGVPLSPSVP